MSTATEVNPRTKALTEAGVSVWLDQLGRQLVGSGELAKLIAEDSLRGVTSNPSIFEKSILGTTDYDEQIGTLARDGADAKTIYDALVIEDVQNAADVLRDTWEKTNHADGFVSLEVQPDLARDTEKSIESARHYWKALDRPNVMIKIPGTDEGVPAIEEAIYDGINVNVTLLFAVEAYEKIANAYIRGLERRHAEGKSLDVHSVASFFVSRVDTAVDKQLDAAGGDALALRGTAAIANAQDAYRRFEQLFSGDRWDALAAAGAVVQRPLWASTGTKNPEYSDVKYVDGLVAPHTVNTMPMATLDATADHGQVSGETAAQDPTEALRRLADAGIDMTAVTHQLLADGITQFEDAMNGLIAGIDDRRVGVLTERPGAVQASLPEDFQGNEVTRIRQADAEHVAARIWKRDTTLWSTEDIGDWLGWLNVSELIAEHAADLVAFATGLEDEGYTDALLLGMGGSSLGPEVLRQSFGDQPGGLRLQVLDSTHPDAITAVEGSLDLEKTIFIVSSKSGGTIETLSHYRYLKTKAKPEQFVVVTDPGSPLEQLAADDGLRRTFLNPTNIGGRYSVMSYFGMVPAALAGYGVDELVHSCQVGEQACSHLGRADENSGLWLGATVGEFANRGLDKLTFIVSEPIGSFGLWVEQLVAESTGKQGKGILPVAGEPLGDPDVYGEDRVFVYLRHVDDPDATLDAFVDKLTDAGKPTITVSAHGATDLGRLFFISEFAVAVAGWALGIDPFDQPNVQEAKDNTNKVLASGSVPQIDAADDDALTGLLADANPPHYVAILGYLAPSDAIDAAIARLRTAIRAHTGAATTFGYGPRFQHSTGQEHNGGRPDGRFLQLVDTPTSTVPIPGESYDFGTLIASQAAGNLQTLRGHGLPAERIDLGSGDPAAAIDALTDRIQRLLASSR